MARRIRKLQDDEDGERKPSTRDLWKGSISFGLVEIPVALVGAERPRATPLRFLDRRDFSPIGNKRYNRTTGEDVAWSDVVHGYEHEKGEFVVLSKQDLERVKPELAHTIEIERFVDQRDVDPIYYEKPYYVEPLKPRSKGYALLRETLRRTGKVGVARVVVRTREHIGLLGVRGPSLVLYLLRFADEVRPETEVENVDATLKDVGVRPKEVEMAEKLVEDMHGEWDPEQYSDDYAGKLRELIDQKIAKGATHVLDERPPGAPKHRGEILDLMPLLKRSLEANRGRPKRGRPAQERTRRARTAKKRRSA